MSNKEIGAAAFFYQTLHHKIQTSYVGCGHATLANKAQRKQFKKVNAAFNRAAKYLHNKGSFTPTDLNHPQVKPLITQTYNALKLAVNTGIETAIPGTMLNKLHNDVFVFSGMKTYAQLKEASLLLLDENKQIKPFDKFKADVLKINSTYNTNYLQAEHQTAMAAANSASYYHKFMQTKGQYNLQIRTANDDKVRKTHAPLHNVTKADDDPFWNNTWPPFDWRCRCRVIQVLKDEYPSTDDTTANQAAKKAVAENFNYNPGKEQTIFPKKHPYYPQHCNGAKLNLTGLVGLGKWLLTAETDRCKAMNLVKRMTDLENPILIKEYENGGKIIQSTLVDNTASDYANVLKCCQHHAALGLQTEILPKVDFGTPEYKKYFGNLIGTKYERKCPDYRVGDNYYELEGFTTNNPAKNALSNMLSAGVKQAKRIVIMDEGSTIRHIKKQVYLRIIQGQLIEELWVLRQNGTLEQVY